MKTRFLKLLAGYDYHSLADFGQSLMPSQKYHGFTLLTVGTSALFVPFDKIFGLNGMAFLALIVVFVAELTSGIVAAHIKGEKIESHKLSRFLFKVFYYLVLIFVPYALYNSFAASHKDIPAAAFDWLHMFLITQIAFENIISIIENMSVISGKDKTAWISKIQDAINNLLTKQA